MTYAHNWDEVFAMSRKGITGRVDVIYGVEFNLDNIKSHIIEAEIHGPDDVDRIGERYETETK